MGNRRISPLIILPPLIFLGLAFLFILGVKRENPNDLPSVFIDQPAPNITESPYTALTQFCLQKLLDQILN